ncbi:MAG: bifunctional folylpolyglutamate synthase/dihydrofolate synthase [Campylobacterales bacterium 16-40-21]|nr:MAG: bifunctional folylpolyglutamate synthase/dihydrofolate synthase [Campylobacterales bacterium 16-40-21]
MDLESFLAAKPLFYDVIDYDRFPKAYAKIAHFLHLPKIIHIVGTNGKGSTGRFLATALSRAGKKTGHYTSPHILQFNERIWIDGEDVSDATLNDAYQKLGKFLDTSTAESLSYFEYTTLLAMVAFESCEYVVLEAGLGGEFDATNVFDKVLSIFTPIAFDHAAFLGSTIESIASTKLRSMQTNALLGIQKYDEVQSIAHEIAVSKQCRLQTLQESIDSRIRTRGLQLALKNGLSEYLRDNCELAMVAFELLGYKAQEVYFDQKALFGRLSKVAHNVTLDVGHNALAASAIAAAFQGKKISLIYNSYGDKDYREILSLLAPIIDCVEIITVDEERIVERPLLEAVLVELGLTYGTFESIDPQKEYLVFGSFSVAEAFLKRKNNP